MKIKSLAHFIAIASLLSTAASAAIIVHVDMDTVTPGIQSTRTVATNEIFTISLLMQLGGSGDSVSSYGVSVNFDNVELSLNGAPASTELLPAGFGTNSNAGVNSESQASGQVRTFEAFSDLSGPVFPSIFTIGTISFKATAPVTDGLLDITPGLFNPGFDEIINNAFNDVGPTAAFFGGQVHIVPEPSTALLGAIGIFALFPPRKRNARNA